MAKQFEHLLSSVTIAAGSVQLKHRVVMAPMTRTRNDPLTYAPRQINALYYSQRTSEGGLLIAEATAVSASAEGYLRAPGMYTEAHIDGWKLVTGAVHAKGGFIFSQLFHAGRVSHSHLLPEDVSPVAPSAVKAEGYAHTKLGKFPFEEPRALETQEIAGIVKDFALAATRAVEEAGFDGIELHAGNGYLLQEFLAKKTNLRTDHYGGSIPNRARFVLEVVDACVAAVGAKRVAIKLQQGATFSDLVEPEDDSLAQLAYLGPQLQKRNLAYVCMSSLNYDPYYKFLGLEKPNFETDVFQYFRKHYQGTLMVNGGLSPQVADRYVEEGTADLACFAIFFIANANLVALLAAGKELNLGGWDTKIWYGPQDPADDEKYYTDWPFVDPNDPIAK
ncbi:hypothetical protein O6H91_05G016000 [Diphasiastrum complanatum]|uniref:Uncharacterized protein n=1 Tax=Diphasiastrum complanatum TaxID=34168 RepID=A0ACC2DKV3_DIPCM|nr:hypothetical protein O6H91_05G016000 [Diphasiastrum complanatum]